VNPGFTLLEVMVALAVGGLVVLFAQRLLGQVAAGLRASAVAQRDLDREQNARRLVQSLLLSLEVGDEGGAFEGEGNQVAFAAWLQRPEGWFVRERVRLGWNNGRVETLTSQGAIVLWDSVATLDLDYLLEPGATTSWVRRWTSPVSAPVALRVRLGRRVGQAVVADTLLFLIKERG